MGIKFEGASGLALGSQTRREASCQAPHRELSSTPEPPARSQMSSIGWVQEPRCDMIPSDNSPPGLPSSHISAPGPVLPACLYTAHLCSEQPPNLLRQLRTGAKPTPRLPGSHVVCLQSPAYSPGSHRGILELLRTSQNAHSASPQIQGHREPLLMIRVCCFLLFKGLNSERKATVKNTKHVVG